MQKRQPQKLDKKILERQVKLTDDIIKLCADAFEDLHLSTDYTDSNADINASVSSIANAIANALVSWFIAVFKATGRTQAELDLFMGSVERMFEEPLEDAIRSKLQELVEDNK